jgi:hypothetical protein
MDRIIHQIDETDSEQRKYISLHQSLSQQDSVIAF